jgi:hypothetical protein
MTALSDVELAAVARARRRLLAPAGHVMPDDRTYLMTAQAALRALNLPPAAWTGDTAAFPIVVSVSGQRSVLGLLEEVI